MSFSKWSNYENLEEFSENHQKFFVKICEDQAREWEPEKKKELENPGLVPSSDPELYLILTALPTSKKGFTNNHAFGA